MLNFLIITLIVTSLTAISADTCLPQVVEEIQTSNTLQALTEYANQLSEISNATFIQWQDENRQLIRCLNNTLGARKLSFHFKYQNRRKWFYCTYIYNGVEERFRHGTKDLEKDLQVDHSKVLSKKYDGAFEKYVAKAEAKCEKAKNCDSSDVIQRARNELLKIHGSWCADALDNLLENEKSANRTQAATVRAIDSGDRRLAALFCLK